MLITSSHTLKKLAAIVWYAGVVILLLKSTGLFIHAYSDGVKPAVLVVSVLTGLAIGWIKSKYMFVNICKKNLRRICELKEPRLWQFYRIRFFFFLGLMIFAGNYFSRLAKGNNSMVVLLAVLELSIATALFLSSHCFWTHLKTTSAK